MSQARSQCDTCTRYRTAFDRPDGDFSGPVFCAAFPDGIPARVFDNSLDHRQPVDGDHGLRWESDGEPFPEWAFQPDRLGVGGKP